MKETTQSAKLLVRPQPTERAFIDIGRICSVRCEFCYHKHVPFKGYKSLDELKKEVANAHSRGNNYIDFTGGEPTLVPHLPEVIEYLNSLGMRCRIITCGVINPKRLERILDAKPHDWLISVHATSSELHDSLVNFTGARKFQRALAVAINNRGGHLCFNTVINRYNYHELTGISLMAAMWGAHAVNFINFNPHHAWKQHMDEARDIIADLREVQPHLEDALAILDNYEIGSNVRYYPMCRLAEKYRSTICNDLHVLFDPYEWDYFIRPKTMETYTAKSLEMSLETEWKGEPCNACDLFNICGGINAHFNKFTKGMMIDAVTNFKGDKQDAFWYRQHNVKTLKAPSW